MAFIQEAWLEIWRPALEILTLAIGIYYGFIFVRRTRGWPVVVGFLGLLALTILTTLLKLKVLSWILQAFFAFSAFAVLVIFQPEVRRMLAGLGRLRFFTPSRSERKVIEVLTEALLRLSRARVGALIAIERTVDLRPHAESWVLVECAPTVEMLETIFFPRSALHDGGVIIRGGRIAYAACIFPLTQQQDLDKSMGTRHRAAIGLSEETDAAIIVVSEETGQISYAFNGELTRNVNVDGARAFLDSVLLERARPVSLLGRLRALRSWRPKERQPSGARRLSLSLLSSGWGLKLSSSIAATLIWFTIQSNIRGQLRPLHPSSTIAENKLSLRLPIQAAGADGGAQRSRIIPGSAELTLSGDAEVLRRLDSAKIRIVIELGDDRPALEPQGARDSGDARSGGPH